MNFGRRKILAIVLVVIAFAITALIVYDQYRQGRFQNKAEVAPITWQSHGVGSAGYNDYIAIDQMEPNRVYIATDVAGLFKSRDGGETWQFANNGITDYEGSAIKIDPLNHQKIYVSTNNGIYLSNDFGDSWTKVNAEIRTSQFQAHNSGTSALALTVKNNQTHIYAIAENKGIFHSQDGAASWTKTSANPQTGGVDDLNFVSIAVAPNNPDHLFVGTTKGLYESPDAGQNWVQINIPSNPAPTIEGLPPQPPNYDIPFIGFNKYNENIVYVLNRVGELFRSDRTAQDQSFSRITPKAGWQFGATIGDYSTLTTFQAAYVDTNPDDHTEDIIYLARKEGWQRAEEASVWTYNSKKNTWETIAYFGETNGNISVPDEWPLKGLIGDNFAGSNSLEIDLTTQFNTRKVFAVNGFVPVIGEKNQSGWQWTYKFKGLENYEPFDGAYDVNNPNNIYVVGPDIGFIKSSDGGETFQRFADGMNPSNPGCTGQTCLAGHTWAVEVIPNQDRTKPSTLFVASQSRGENSMYVGANIYKSTDGGETWQNKSNGLPPTMEGVPGTDYDDPVRKIIYNKENNLLVLNSNRKPKDAAECAEVKGRSCSEEELTRNLFSPVYISRDLGESWQGLPTQGLPSGALTNSGLAYNSQTDEVFLGVYNNNKGLYKIKLGDPSWTAIFADRQILDIERATNGHLFATSSIWDSNGGECAVIKSTDNGSNWATTYKFPTTRNATCWLSLDPSNQETIYANPYGWGNVAGLGIYKSIDGGSTFSEQNQNLSHLNILKTIVHPYNPNKLLALSFGGGMFWSYRPQKISVNIPTIDSSTLQDKTAQQPLTVKGKAEPGVTVNIHLQSAPQDFTATADAQGNWSYTISNGLEAGDHIVKAMAIKEGVPSEYSSPISFNLQTGSTPAATPTPATTPTSSPVISPSTSPSANPTLVPSATPSGTNGQGLDPDQFQKPSTLYPSGSGLIWLPIGMAVLVVIVVGLL